MLEAAPIRILLKDSTLFDSTIVDVVVFAGDKRKLSLHPPILSSKQRLSKGRPWKALLSNGLSGEGDVVNRLGLRAHVGQDAKGHSHNG